MVGDHPGGAALSWHVELPERRGSGVDEGACGGRRRATLAITTEEHGRERIAVPVAVGRALRALEGEGRTYADRSDLLFELDTRSRSCASTRAAALVSRRDYSARELDRKLADDGYGDRVREEVVERYRQLGIVDDRRYAEVFARSKASMGWGPRRIEQELRRRGVDVDTIPGWPDDFLEGGLEERAYEIASRRRVGGRDGFQKLVRYLCSRGYPTDVSYRVARRVVEESESEETA